MRRSLWPQKSWMQNSLLSPFTLPAPKPDKENPAYAIGLPWPVATNLAKAGSLERSCSHEILGLGQEEPSFDHARDSHSCRCDSVSHDRAARANARGLLGRDRDLGRDAID